MPTIEKAPDQRSDRTSVHPSGTHVTRRLAHEPFGHRPTTLLHRGRRSPGAGWSGHRRAVRSINSPLVASQQGWGAWHTANSATFAEASDVRSMALTACLVAHQVWRQVRMVIIDPIPIRRSCLLRPPRTSSGRLKRSPGASSTSAAPPGDSPRRAVWSRRHRPPGVSSRRSGTSRRGPAGSGPGGARQGSGGRYRAHRRRRPCAGARSRNDGPCRRRRG